MRVAFFSHDGATISWARRLMDEGCEVLLYVAQDRKNQIGRGIVPLASSKVQWLAWGAKDPRTVYMFDQTHHGELADSLRSSGKFVLNGGGFQDHLELDRHWGTEIVERAGVRTPPTYKFTSISETIAFLKSNPKQHFGDGGWAWKPDRDIGCDATLVSKDTERIMDHLQQISRRFGDKLKCILQEKIDGVAVSTARWWNGLGWVGPTQGTIENKKLMNDNLGPATGCSFNMVWFYWNNEVRINRELAWDKLAESFRQHNAPPGLYDINAILNSQGAWFLEWTPRLGIDSEMTSQRAISSLKDFLWALVTGGPVDDYFNTSKCYFDIRLSVPPYPNNIDVKDYKSPAIGVPIKGFDGLWDKNFVISGVSYDKDRGLTVADPGGLFGFATMEGTSLGETYKKLYKWVKDTLVVPDIQYRTDAAKIIQDDIDLMRTTGWELTPVLRK
jgi:phosphoribosylamine-glycine ligase